MIVQVTNLTAQAISSDVGLVLPGKSVSALMDARQMYLSSSGLLALENKGYISVSVLEETAANLAAMTPSPLPASFAKEPKVDPTTFQAPHNRQQISNATATTSAPATLTASQSGSVFNNGAAGSQVGFVLPASVPGMSFMFVCTAAAGIRVSGSGAETIHVAASTSTATTGHVDNTAAGSVLSLNCCAAGSWFATATVGTWTVT